MSNVLVVVSKMKSYIKEKHGYNTSGDVADKLTQIIQAECDKAAMNAQAEGRKTLMARDFKSGSEVGSSF